MSEGEAFDKDSIISIPSTLPMLLRLTMELSQPTYILNSVGKVVVDKAPQGAKSPNLADAVMIAYAPESKASTTGLIDLLQRACNGAKSRKRLKYSIHATQ